MVDTQVMSSGKLGLSVRTRRVHTRTVSDLGSPTFVLHRLDPAPSMTGSPRFPDSNGMTTVHEDLKANGGPPPTFPLENGGTKVLAGSNPYLDSGDLGSDDLVTSSLGVPPPESRTEEFGTPDEEFESPDEDHFDASEDSHVTRTFRRGQPFRSKSENMVDAYKQMEQSEEGENLFSPGTVLESPGADSADSHYFELEIARREAENQVEQLKLQLQSKSNQLEQVQIALMSYEEEIMRIRKHGVGSEAGSGRSDGEHESTEDGEDTPAAKPVGKVLRDKIPLGIAEDLSKKIVCLQTNVQELEEEMVRVKLENAQLRETNDFLKNTLSKTSTRGGNRGIRNPFSRQK